MKQLLVVRHAKSSWKQAGLTDHDRPLNHRGKHDVPLLGKAVKESELVPDRVACSDAKRAVATAERVLEACHYGGPVEYYSQLYLAPPEVYFQLLQCQNDADQRILVVGHNPGIEMFVAQLTGEAVTMVTAASVVVQLTLANWAELRPGTGSILSMWTPKGGWEVSA